MMRIALIFCFIILLLQPVEHPRSSTSTPVRYQSVEEIKLHPTHIDALSSVLTPGRHLSASLNASGLFRGSWGSQEKNE